MIEPAYLLDTNFCIDLFLGRTGRGAARVQECVAGTLVTSSIVYAEVMIGAERREQSKAAAKFFRQIEALPFDIKAGDAYAALPPKRANFDWLIAAHALSLKLTLVTSNTRVFADIPGLKIENWTL